MLTNGLECQKSYFKDLEFKIFFFWRGRMLLDPRTWGLPSASGISKPFSKILILSQNTACLVCYLWFGSVGD